MSEQFSLEQFYDAYPRLEADFQAALDGSLNPRGPELLYDLVSDLRLPQAATVVDVGCGEGKHTLKLAERFHFAGTSSSTWPHSTAHMPSSGGSCARPVECSCTRAP